MTAAHLLNALAAELDSFEPSDEAEAAALHQIRVLIETADAPAARNSFQPGHLTASAVVRNQDTGRVLLVQHPKLRRWLQPGGHVEPEDRSLLDSAKREAFEEVGPVKVESRGLVDVDVHPFPAFGSEPEHLHHDIRYLFDLMGPEPLLAGSHQSRWVGWDELAGLGTDQSVVRLVRKALHR